MATEVAEFAAQKGEKISRGAAEVFVKILEILISKINDEAMAKPYKEMAKYIRDGEDVYSYRAIGPNPGQIRDEMLKRLQSIPYIKMADEDEIIIRACDLEKVMEMNRQILVEKTDYYQEVPMEELLRAGEQKNENLFMVAGLDKYEAEVFRNKCNNITKGFMVGNEKVADGFDKDGSKNYKYNIATFREKVFDEKLKPEEGTRDVCRAYLEAMVSIHGSNAKQKESEIKHDERVDNRVWETVVGDKDTIFVASSGEYFMEINPNGIEIYRDAYEKNENNEIKRVQQSIVRVSKDDINFGAEVQKWLDKMNNKIICEDFETLNKVLGVTSYQRTSAGLEKEGVDGGRPERDPKAQAVSTANMNLTIKIDEIVRKRMASHKTMLLGMSEEQKFRTYQQQAADLLVALRDGRRPSDIDLNEWDKLSNIGKYGCVEFNEKKGIMELFIPHFLSGG